jgi:hypothetical protein
MQLGRADPTLQVARDKHLAMPMAARALTLYRLLNVLAVLAGTLFRRYRLVSARAGSLCP